MLFHVASREYRLRIMPGLMRDTEGHEIAGCVDWSTREIHISGNIPPACRMEVLGHELRHAWLHAMPRPRTEEEDCAFSAAVQEAMYSDLQAQGGREALESMVEVGECPRVAPEPAQEERRLEYDDGTPIGMVFPVESAADAHGGRAQCGKCGWIVAGGSIVTGCVEYEPKFHGKTVHRTLYCPHCHHLQSWVEGVDPITGAPNDDVAAGPEYTRGPAVDAFLREHTEAAGMVVE
jgi:hypothetical protein